MPADPEVLQNAINTIEPRPRPVPFQECIGKRLMWVIPLWYNQWAFVFEDKSVAIINAWGHPDVQLEEGKTLHVSEIQSAQLFEAAGVFPKGLCALVEQESQRKHAMMHVQQEAEKEKQDRQAYLRLKAKYDKLPAQALRPIEDNPGVEG